MTEKNENTETFWDDNKPLYNSILMGFLYIILILLSTPIFPFILLMFVLPGVTFPLTTSYFQTGHLNYRFSRIFAHFCLSVATYYFIVCFTFPDHWIFPPVFTGFFGSLIYLVSTKYLLKKQLNWLEIIVVSMLSGCAFIPWMLDWGLFSSSFAVFTWTVVNGWLLNREYRLERQIQRV